MTRGAKMVDVGQKTASRRVAEAEGRIVLKAATLEAIRRGPLDKGDVLEVARTAAILAVKQTPLLLPLCHPIPLDGVDVDLQTAQEHLTCRVRVSAHHTTGVEMESLVGVTVGLLTVWDMVKPLEKDAAGQYPSARIEGVRVLKKVKE